MGFRDEIDRRTRDAFGERLRAYLHTDLAMSEQHFQGQVDLDRKKVVAPSGQELDAIISGDPDPLDATIQVSSTQGLVVHETQSFYTPTSGVEGLLILRDDSFNWFVKQGTEDTLYAFDPAIIAIPNPMATLEIVAFTPNGLHLVCGYSFLNPITNHLHLYWGYIENFTLNSDTDQVDGTVVNGSFDLFTQISPPAPPPKPTFPLTVMTTIVGTPALPGISGICSPDIGSMTRVSTANYVEIVDPYFIAQDTPDFFADGQYVVSNDTDDAPVIDFIGNYQTTNVTSLMFGFAGATSIETGSYSCACGGPPSTNSYILSGGPDVVTYGPVFLDPACTTSEKARIPIDFTSPIGSLVWSGFCNFSPEFFPGSFVSTTPCIIRCEDPGLGFAPAICPPSPNVFQVRAVAEKDGLFAIDNLQSGGAVTQTIERTASFLKNYVETFPGNWVVVTTPSESGQDKEYLDGFKSIAGNSAAVVLNNDSTFSYYKPYTSLNSSISTVPLVFTDTQIINSFPDDPTATIKAVDSELFQTYENDVIKEWSGTAGDFDLTNEADAETLMDYTVEDWTINDEV